MAWQKRLLSSNASARMNPGTVHRLPDKGHHVSADIAEHGRVRAETNTLESQIKQSTAIFEGVNGRRWRQHYLAGRIGFDDDLFCYGQERIFGEVGTRNAVGLREIANSNPKNIDAVYGEDLVEIFYTLLLFDERHDDHVRVGLGPIILPRDAIRTVSAAAHLPTLPPLAIGIESGSRQRFLHIRGALDMRDDDAGRAGVERFHDQHGIVMHHPHQRYQSADLCRSRKVLHVCKTN